MPGLPFAHCCFFSTVITFLRFASQIFFCYREKVIHFLTTELYLYNQHYDLVFKVTVFSTCLSLYTGPQFLGTKNQKVCCRSVVVVEVCLKLLFVVSSCSLLLCCVFCVAELYFLLMIMLKCCIEFCPQSNADLEVMDSSISTSMSVLTLIMSTVE